MPRSTDPIDPEPHNDTVVVLRCANCGDTFPKHAGEPVRCPTCGSGEASEAHEPLL